MLANIKPPVEGEITFTVSLTFPLRQVNEWYDQCMLATVLSSKFAEAVNEGADHDPYEAVDSARLSPVTFEIAPVTVDLEQPDDS